MNADHIIGIAALVFIVVNFLCYFFKGQHDYRGKQPANGHNPYINPTYYNRGKHNAHNNNPYRQTHTNLPHNTPLK